MNVAVIADEALKEAFQARLITGYANICFVNEPRNIPADTYIVFDLLFSNTSERISLLKSFLPRPVFVNAVQDTLAAIGQPFIRINAWPTFFNRDITEVAILPEQEQAVKEVFDYLGWRYQAVPDITGMVSPRITGMIINEAYFTLAEKVSSKAEIDIAMKAGTHYPYGPFEWSRKIGLDKIYSLLVQLAKENKLYEACALLAEETLA